MTLKRAGNGRGAGSIGCLLMLLLVGGGLYAAKEYFLPQFRNTSFMDRLTESYGFFGKQPADAIRRRIIELAADFDIALTPEQVKVKIAGDHLDLDIDYVKVMDLRFWKKEIPFHIHRAGPY